ncbi:hypothetical protein OHU11_35415 [Streptomyces sp. NBC_00257]|uniref:hypothetical protein n=1 Tax=unclassified Streptomyces TaxID=2593676 RepID=UPI0022509B3B|nr:MULTISPECIES: hypothetical protein [unclassified Streptomyces]MCX5432938.1 hypothetical protein [Streptomyces sp. NBC_00062]WTB53163.1 hypothetical protein OG832_08275 [Streptomyces sp. NBC_00826]WTH93946.1 hypothetical protein OIC43_35415 [Streptomyces sp. NBC_00825]WTI02681.1 hypothetical protein OHA23_35395 [Streptomyces sp. NBC_00822]
MGELVKGMVEPLAKRWTAAMSGPLVLFWLAGALLVALRHGGLPDVCRAGTQGPAEPACRLVGQGPWGVALAAAAATAVMVLCAMGLSAVASPLLEMLAGKWGTSAPVVAFARLRTARHAVRRERLAGRAGDLSGPGDLAGDRLAVWRTQNAWRRTGARRLWSHYPRRRDELRPTAVGNALHGVAAGIERNYGLSLPVCWGPFVECLESTARERLVASATRVSGRTQALICAAVAPLWALVLTDAVARLCWLVACALCVWGAYRALRSGVEQYCEHVRDVFAVHRVRLYHAAGFAPPASTEAEVACGRLLSKALAMELTDDVAHAWPETL